MTINGLGNCLKYLKNTKTTVVVGTERVSGTCVCEGRPSCVGPEGSHSVSVRGSLSRVSDWE